MFYLCFVIFSAVLILFTAEFLNLNIMEKAYLANPVKEEELFYFDTVWADNVPHINIGTEESPYYVPQEMFKVTDSFRDYLLKRK